MALTFSGTAQYLTRGSAVLTAVPITFACWVNPTNFTSSPWLLALGQSGNTDRFEMLFQATGTASAQSVATSVGATATTAATATAGVWSHVCAVFASSTSRSIYLNGGNKVSNTTSNTPVAGNINNTTIAVNPAAAPGHLLTGSIAFPAIWNIALSDSDVALLGAGYTPLAVQPQGLVAYAPLYGFPPEPDLISSIPWIATGAPTYIASPTIMGLPIANDGRGISRVLV